MPSSVWIGHNFYMNGFCSPGITSLMFGICGPKFCSSISLLGALRALWKFLFGGLFNKSSFNVREDVDPNCSHRGCRSAWVMKMPWFLCGFPIRSIRNPSIFWCMRGGLYSRNLLPALLSDLRSKKPVSSTSQVFRQLPRIGSMAVPAEGRLVSQVLASM